MAITLTAGNAQPVTFTWTSSQTFSLQTATTLGVNIGVLTTVTLSAGSAVYSIVGCIDGTSPCLGNEYSNTFYGPGATPINSPATIPMVGYGPYQPGVHTLTYTGTLTFTPQVASDTATVDSAYGVAANLQSASSPVPALPKPMTVVMCALLAASGVLFGSFRRRASHPVRERSTRTMP
jgi:hypothetical protein